MQLTFSNLLSSYREGSLCSCFRKKVIHEFEVWVPDDLNGCEVFSPPIPTEVWLGSSADDCESVATIPKPVNNESCLPHWPFSRVPLKDAAPPHPQTFDDELSVSSLLLDKDEGQLASPSFDGCSYESSPRWWQEPPLQPTWSHSTSTKLSISNVLR